MAKSIPKGEVFLKSEANRKTPGWRKNVHSTEPWKNGYQPDWGREEKKVCLSAHFEIWSTKLKIPTTWSVLTKQENPAPSEEKNAKSMSSFPAWKNLPDSTQNIFISQQINFRVSASLYQSHSHFHFSPLINKTVYFFDWLKRIQ